MFDDFSHHGRHVSSDVYFWKSFSRARCLRSALLFQMARRGGAGDARYRGPRIQRDGARIGRLPIARPNGTRGLLLLIAARSLFAVLPGTRYFSPRPYMHTEKSNRGVYLCI